MATVSDLEITPRSGLNHIDALLDSGPDWNYLMGVAANTIFYTFSVTSGNEVDPTTGKAVSGQEAFTQAQQLATRSAFDYLQKLTGIQFVETANGSSAQVHLANLNIEASNTTGLCSWQSSYSYGAGNVLTAYSADAYVYLDNVEWRAQNRDLTPGGMGFQTLLHELGHAMGLKHPFDGDVHLAGGDNTTNTLMSYTDVGGPYSAFSPYDVAALNWLYGGDGLGGALGINSAGGGRYFTGTAGADLLTGTAANDSFAGMGGNDLIDGGAGTDTVVFSGARGDYLINQNSSGNVVVSHAALGTVTLASIEQFNFTDASYGRSQLVADTVAPNAPTVSVLKNAAGYTSYSKPVISGSAEPNSLVRVYAGDTLVAELQVDANGIFSGPANTVFGDGQNYSVRATATDASGNVSPYSASVTFHVDATAPVMPTSSMTMAQGGNQPGFSGNAEAGTTIQLIHISEAAEIGRAVAKADGTWQMETAPLPNGVYRTLVSSVDKAGNATSAGAYLDFAIDSALNQTGNQLDNLFTAGAGNNAINGMGGIDTVVYNGASSGFTIARGIYGTSVTDKSGVQGTDNLVNVERIQFSDGFKAIDIDGIGGQVYRLYEAVFGRPSDTAGMGYWINRMEKGTSLLQVSREFITNQPEFDKLYGANPSDGEFLTKLYQNILDREPDAAGYAYWVGRIVDSSREQILMEFSEGFENQAQVIGTIGSGIDYTPWTGA